VHGAGDAPAAHDGHFVGDVHDLAQLVGNQDDGFSLLLEQPQDFKQRPRFLRCEHGSRLVQNQDVGAAVDLLENFNPLLGPHRQLVDGRQWVDVEAVARADLAQLRFYY